MLFDVTKYGARGYTPEEVETLPLGFKSAKELEALLKILKDIASRFGTGVSKRYI